MSLSFGSEDKEQSQGAKTSESKPLSPEELKAYTDQLNLISGGRLNTFATTGTPQLTPEQIQAVGGLGADRQRALAVARRQAVDQVAADPNLTVAQRQRSTQLTDQDYNDRLAAVTKEAEGLKTGLAQYNAGLTKEDLKLLADIYFGGKGQNTQGWGTNTSTSGFNAGFGYTPGTGFGPLKS